ncbi:MAG TPA: hypothetical protein VF812_09960 [Ktedonobacterales bacterium]
MALAMARSFGSQRPARRLAVGVGLAALLIALGFVMALQPATADRFGYALPGSYGLPGHFTYQGVTYSNVGLCAGGSWCASARTGQWAQATRWSQPMFGQDGEWPLRQVASLPTLFGASHAIYEPVNDPSMTGAGGPYVGDAHPFVLFIQDPGAPGWYYAYTRPGGP